MNRPAKDCAFGPKNGCRQENLECHCQYGDVARLTAGLHVGSLDEISPVGFYSGLRATGAERLAAVRKVAQALSGRPSLLLTVVETGSLKADRVAVGNRVLAQQHAALSRLLRAMLATTRLALLEASTTVAADAK